MTTIEHPIPRLYRPLWQRLLRALLHIVMLAIDVMGLALSLTAVAWLIIGDTSLFTWHFSNLLPALIALSPMIAIIGLMGRKQWFAFHLIPALLFLGIYGEYYIPKAVSVPDDTPQLRVMTFNTRYVHDSAYKLADIILESDADVIALQELSTPAADYFLEYLSDAYPYQITHTNGLSVTGKGLLSRYPLTNDSLETLDRMTYILRAEFVFAGETVTIINAHPSPPSYGINFNAHNRGRHITWLLDYIEQQSNPLILLGDFNTTQHSTDYDRLTANLHDSFRDAGWGLGQTFPSGEAFRKLDFFPPLIRIDYVFHSDDLQAVSSQVWHTSGGSDHIPVVTDLIWKSE